MSSSRIPLSLMCVWLGSSLASAAEFRSQEEVAGARQLELKPIIVCPPRFSTPMFVPADVLLQEAEQVQLVTPEGWIVRNHPVNDCINCLGDAATRSYELFEYPLKLRQFNSQIRQVEAEVASWQRRMATYMYFNKAGALFVTVENTHLALFEAHERLRNLRYERMLFVRLHNLERQLGQGVVVDQPVIYGN